MQDIAYSVVVPLYNEELVIDSCYERLKEVMEDTGESYEIIFVNDGSIDFTEEKAADICKKDGKVKLINFSRNFGHQAAITAGMNEALGDAVVIIDADLQDPPEVILEMIKKWKGGYDIVYGKRVKREGETLFKKITANVYYRLLRSMTSIDVPVDAGDFRLMDRKAYKTLCSLPEKNRYVRGLVSWIGYKQTYVEYERHERFAGESKYPLKKMMKLAFDGITALSFKPLVVPLYIGGVTFIFGILSLAAVLVNSIVKNTPLLNIGFALSINLLLFGMLFGVIGIMGQYIGRIFDESKNRPLYIIDNVINYKEAEIKYKIIK